MLKKSLAISVLVASFLVAGLLAGIAADVAKSPSAADTQLYAGAKPRPPRA